MQGKVHAQVHTANDDVVQRVHTIMQSSINMKPLVLNCWLNHVYGMSMFGQGLGTLTLIPPLEPLLILKWQPLALFLCSPLRRCATIQTAWSSQRVSALGARFPNLLPLHFLHLSWKPLHAMVATWKLLQASVGTLACKQTVSMQHAFARLWCVRST